MSSLGLAILVVVHSPNKNPPAGIHNVNGQICRDTAAPGPTAFLSGHPETGIGGARVFCESSVTVFRFRGRFVGGSARLTSASSIRVCRSSGPSTTAVALVLLRRPRGAHDLDVLAHPESLQERPAPQRTE